MERIMPEIGMSVKGDEWSWFKMLGKDDGFKDGSFPGCQFRLEDSGHTMHGFAVNIKVTGKPKWNGIQYQSRCVIEFVGDGEPSEFVKGVLYHKHA